MHTKRSDGTLWALYILGFFSASSFAIVIPSIFFFMSKLKLNTAYYGIVVAAFSLGQVFGSIPVGFLSSRFGAKPILICCLLINIVGFVVYAFSRGLAVMIVARFVSGFGTGYITVIRGYVGEACDPKIRSSVSGYITIGQMIGYALGPTVFATIFTPVSFTVNGFTVDAETGPPLASAVLKLIAIIMIIVVFRPLNTSELRRKAAAAVSGDHGHADEGTTADSASIEAPLLAATRSSFVDSAKSTSSLPKATDEDADISRRYKSYPSGSSAYGSVNNNSTRSQPQQRLMDFDSLGEANDQDGGDVPPVFGGTVAAAAAAQGPSSTALVNPWPGLWYLAWLYLLDIGLFSAFETNIAPLVKHMYGWGTLQSNLTTGSAGVVALAYVFVMDFLGRRAKWSDALLWTLCMFGFLVGSLFLLAPPHQHLHLALLVSGLVAFSTAGPGISLLYAMFAQICSRHRINQQKATGVMVLAGALGRLAGPLWAAYAFHYPGDDVTGIIVPPSPSSSAPSSFSSAARFGTLLLYIPLGCLAFISAIGFAFVVNRHPFLASKK